MLAYKETDGYTANDVHQDHHDQDYYYKYKCDTNSSCTKKQSLLVTKMLVIDW